MEVMDGVNIGDTISFSVLSNVSAVITTKFDSVKVVALLDADSAKALIEPFTLHRNIFPLLEDGTCVDDPYAYYYLKVKLTNGKYAAVAIPWIDLTTIENSASTTATLTVSNISVSDLTRLKDHIAAGGWYLVDATMV